MNRPFTLDKDNARLMGVCAGLARSADMDPFWSASRQSR
jgi:phage shock protein PspC (stress-responsive transcriptional regulator)